MERVSVLIAGTSINSTTGNGAWGETRVVNEVSCLTKTGNRICTDTRNLSGAKTGDGTGTDTRAGTKTRLNVERIC